MKIALTIFLLLINISHTLAETSDSIKPLKEYDVEIIIFEDAHARYINSESWNKNSAEENEIRSNNLAHKITSTPNYKDIKPGILNKDYKSIKNSSEYNILQYSAWRQTGLKSDNAFEINIINLKNNHRNQTGNTISGKVKIVLARYLHFYGDLEYQKLSKQNDDINDISNEEVKHDSSVTPANTNYILNSHRRMRSKELHYIDHPLVGILIQINPVEVSPED